MSWRRALYVFVRFIGWQTRLNRMQFGVGYVALCFGGGILLQMIFFAIASMAGGIQQVLNHPEWTTPLFLLMLPLLWGLISGRAHDIGWPGWPIVMLYLLPWPAWSVFMDGAFGYFGGEVARLGAGIPTWVLEVSVFGPAVLILIALVVLASVPGQRRANRYGEPPRPGLWSDLPPERA